MLTDRAYRTYMPIVLLYSALFPMTLAELQQKLKDRIRSAARELFGVELQQFAA